MTAKGIVFAVLAGLLLIGVIASLGGNNMANDWSDERCLVARVEALGDDEDADDAMAKYIVHCGENDEDPDTCRP